MAARPTLPVLFGPDCPDEGSVMNPQVTMVCANLGMSAAFELMLESFLKYHRREDVLLHVFNEPTDSGLEIRDDATEYSDKVADKCFTTPTLVPHGVALDILCKSVDTPFTLVVDNDIELSGKVLQMMLDRVERDASAGVCAPCSDLGRTELYGVETRGMQRVEPWCALLRTDVLQRVVRHYSWSSYGSRDLGEHWDVGGMILKGINFMGLDVSRDAEIPKVVKHFGCVSWGAYAPEGSPIRVIADARYAQIKQRLSDLRSEV